MKKKKTELENAASALDIATKPNTRVRVIFCSSLASSDDVRVNPNLMSVDFGPFGSTLSSSKDATCVNPNRYAGVGRCGRTRRSNYSMP